MIDVTYSATKMVVRSPYHPLFPQEARKLNGSHENGVWTFDFREKNAVLKKLKVIYGYTEEGKDDLVDLLVEVDPTSDLRELKAAIFIAGRCIARAFNRDGGAKLGEGIVVREGSFSSGGSAKNWTTESSYGVQFIIRDIYRVAANNVENMLGSLSSMSFEILEREEPLQSTDEPHKAPDIDDDSIYDDRTTKFISIVEKTIQTLIDQRTVIDELIAKQEALLASIRS